MSHHFTEYKMFFLCSILINVVLSAESKDFPTQSLYETQKVVGYNNKTALISNNRLRIETQTIKILLKPQFTEFDSKTVKSILIQTITKLSWTDATNGRSMCNYSILIVSHLNPPYGPEHIIMKKTTKCFLAGSEAHYSHFYDWMPSNGVLDPIP